MERNLCARRQTLALIVKSIIIDATERIIIGFHFLRWLGRPWRRLGFVTADLTTDDLMTNDLLADDTMSTFEISKSVILISHL